MNSADRNADPNVYDLVGVGFGPAGIALAASLDDHAERSPAGARPRVLFLERAASSAWQPDLLLPGTDIQHHYLRDFATPRDPRSRFTFSSYLVQTGQFYRFTLMGNHVTRQHWSDYVEWTAGQVTAPVAYHREVRDIAPVTVDGRVVAARVTSLDPRDGRRYAYLARAVVVASGYQPAVPELFRPRLGDRVFHASELLSRIEALPPQVDRVAVIGAGQTAGEVALYLHSRFPRARVDALLRNAGFRMYELGHFSNEAFFPEETDYFYQLDHDQRQRALAGVYATNYAAVDPDLSTALYRTAFEEKLTGRERLRVHKRTQVTGCEPDATGVRLDLAELNTGARETIMAGAVVLCTGYTEPRPPAALAAFAPHLRLDADGDLAVGPTYRVEVTDDCAVGIYLSGITEWRHGIGTATSFSQMALRAEAIRDDLQKWLTNTPTTIAAQRKESCDAQVHL